MSKLHPTAIDGVKPYTPNDIEKLIAKQLDLVQADDNSRSGWLQRHMYFRDRRFCRTDRGTSFPWPGASDVVMPVEDTKLEETKSVFIRVCLGTPEIASFVLHRPDRTLQDQRISDSLFFNWLLRHGMRDFQEQMVIGFDTLLQSGYAPMKTYWDYRTQRVKRVFRRRDFLSRYPQMINQITEMSTSMMFMNSPGEFLGDRAVAQKKVASRVLDSMKPLIIRDCSLDPEEKTDKEAIDKIMRGLNSGEDMIHYQTVEVLVNLPRTVAVDPEDFIVPASSTIHFQGRKTHRMWMPEETLIQTATRHQWSKSALARVLESGKDGRGGKEGSSVMSTSRFSQFQRDHREGVFSSLVREKMYEVWEHHFWLDTDGDKVPEPVWCVIHPGTSTLLSDIRHEPYDHGGDPFDILSFELNDARFFSPRGMPEILNDISWEITLMHRAKMNNMDMLVPAFTKKIGSFLEAGDVNYIPGEMYDVVDHDALRPIAVPDYTLQNDRGELQNLGWIERRVGGLDPMSSQQSIHEARTAAEINAIQAATRDVLGYRLFLVQRGMSRIFDKVWDLCNQYLPSQMYERVTGKRFVRKSKDEIRNDYSIVPVGRLETTDPTIERQAALQRLQTLLQIIQVNGSAVFDNRYRVNLGEATRRWLERDNPIDAQAIMEELSPEERAAMAQEETRARELGLMMQENLPLSERDQADIVNQVSKVSPHGKRQRVRAG